MADGDNEGFSEMARELLANDANPVEILAAILKDCYEDILEEGNYSEIESVNSNVDKAGKTRLFIALGKKDAMTPKKIVDLVVKKTQINPAKIKGVEVYENFSFMSVPFVEAETIVETFKKERKGRKPLVEKAKERN